MNRSLISILLMVASIQQAVAQTAGLPTVSVTEPSTLSLLAAGIIALGVARRRATK